LLQLAEELKQSKAPLTEIKAIIIEAKCKRVCKPIKQNKREKKIQKKFEDAQRLIDKFDYSRNKASKIAGISGPTLKKW